MTDQKKEQGAVRAVTGSQSSTRRRVANNQQTDQATFEQVKGLVLNMSDKHKRDVIQLLGGTPAQTETAPEEFKSRLLHAEMGEVLSEASGGTVPPYEIMVRSLHRELRAAVKTVDAYLSSRHTGLDSLTKVQYIACLKFLLKVIVPALHKIPIPVTPRTLLQQTCNVAYLMDESFPGYSASGMMPAVFKTVLRGSNEKVLDLSKG